MTVNCETAFSLRRHAPWLSTSNNAPAAADASSSVRSFAGREQRETRDRHRGEIERTTYHC